MDNNSDRNNSRLFIGLATILSIVFIILVGVYMYLRTSKEGGAPAKALVNNAQHPRELPKESSESPAKGTFTAPSVYFSSYQKIPHLVDPAVPSDLKTYTLKTPLSDAETDAMARVLGVNEFKKVDPETGVVVYHTTTPRSPTLGYLSINKQAGSFTFLSFGLHKGSKSLDSTKNPGAYVLSFLAPLGIDTDTVSCPFTYKRKDDPLTYVECHRDLRTSGMRIVGYPGILNVSEGTSLTSLKLGEGESTPPDNSIVSVSRISQSSSETTSQFTSLPSESGKARPNDYNTITVGLAKDGRIISVDSNIRLVQKTSLVSVSEMLSPQEAFNAFTSHKALTSLTVPAGKGAVEWNKVYPSNAALAKSALITDYVLVYVENPANVSQTVLEPQYLIRGTATLESGYSVRFVEIIPALKNSFVSGIMRSIASKAINSSSLVDVAADASTPKVGTLGFGPRVTLTPTPTPTDLPGAPTRTPTPTDLPGAPTRTPTPMVPTDTPEPTEPPVLGACEIGGITRIRIELPDGNSVEVAALGVGSTFYLVSRTSPDTTYDEVKEAIYGRAIDQMVIFAARSALKKHNNGDDSPLTFSYVESDNYPSLDGMQYYPEYSSQAMDYYEASVLPHGIDGAGGITEWANKGDLFDTPALNGLFHIFRTNGTYSPISPNSGCIYITGESPSLFLYSSSPLQSRVELQFPITYSDAPSESSSQKATSYQVYSAPNSPLVFSGGKVSRPYLYYEYDSRSVSLTSSVKRWSIPSTQLETQVRTTISKELGLNREEEKALIADIHKSIQDAPEYASSRYIVLTLVGQKEVDAKLPLLISPQPHDVSRIHFIVASSENAVTDTRSLPSIFPLQRGSHYAVEVGARLP